MEKRQRIENLPPALRSDRAYLSDAFWKEFLQWEH
jgi:hypothetical protein